MSAELIAKRILIFLYDLKKVLLLRSKAKKIMSHLAQSGPVIEPTADLVGQFRSQWKSFSRKANATWLKIYGNTSGNWDHRYVPEDIYYIHIEPCLNNKVFSKTYTDKNFYSSFLSGLDVPETIACNREGVFYNRNEQPLTMSGLFALLGTKESFILKPAVDSGGGKNVTLWRKKDGIFHSNDGATLTEEYIRKRCTQNYIFQNVIESHPFYSRYNSTSLNTVRVLTYRSVTDESINILQSVLRVGLHGSITDNQAAGGYACGITHDGKLSGYAVDKKGNRYAKVNDVELVPGTSVEGYDKIVQAAYTVAAKYHYSRLLGLDLCLDHEGNVKLIEVNNVNNEINFFQMLNGPLFSCYTEEIVKWCTKRRRSFVIDFEI